MRIKKYDSFLKESKDYPESETIEFIKKISSLITTNWEFYDVDFYKIDDLIETYIPSDKFIKFLSEENASTLEEKVAIRILNVGYTVGYINGNSILPSKHIKFKFEEFFDEIRKFIKIDQFDYKKLSYDGPDIRSSSILASSINIKQEIRSIKRYIEEHFSDENNAEVIIILGKIYQYGYGAGHDIGHEKLMSLLKVGDFSNLFKRKTKS